MTRNEMPGVVQARQIKKHIAGLIDQSDQMPELAVAMRYVMDRYSETGAKRSFACRTEPVKFKSFSAEWIIPEGADPSRRIVYIHGGGWFAGSVDTHRHLIDMIALATKRPVLAANYRLAPECAFPAGLEDAREAFAWAQDNGPWGPGAADHVALVGDSAGGNISSAVVVDLLTRGEAGPDALALLSGVVDFRPPSETPSGLDDPTCSPEVQVEIAKLYLQGVTTVDDPLVSPAAADPAVLAQFPPTLIQAGSDEYLRDQGVAFAAMLWNLGVTVQLSVWAHQPHAFQLFPHELLAAPRAVDEIAAFLAVAPAAETMTR